MNIFDDIFEFCDSELFARPLPEPTRVVLTLSPQADRDLRMDKRHRTGPTRIFDDTPYEVAHQPEPWIAWIEYGPERRRVDRLAKGLLNVGTTERQEAMLRALFADYSAKERTYKTARRGSTAFDTFEMFAAQRAMEYIEAAIHDMLDTYGIPFAVALAGEGMLTCMTHPRHKGDEAMIERAQSAGWLVAAAQRLIPHESRMLA